MLQTSFNQLPFVLEPLSPSNITWSVCGPAKLQRSSLCPGRGAGWTEEARVGGLSAQIHLIPASRSPTPASTRPLVFCLDPWKPPALLVCLPAGAFFFSFFLRTVKNEGCFCRLCPPLDPLCVSFVESMWTLGCCLGFIFVWTPLKFPALHLCRPSPRSPTTLTPFLVLGIWLIHGQIMTFSHFEA